MFSARTMAITTMNLAGADKPFLPWAASRPPGSAGQGVRAETQPALPRTSSFERELKGRRRDLSPDFEQGWDQASIAGLSAGQISEMSHAELARVVRAARLPTVQTRPEYVDRVTLERLAYLARLCCHNREGLSTMTAIE